MKIVSFFLLCFLFSGCAPFKYSSFSHHEILIAATQIDISDGVNQDEAVLLALQTILEKGLADRLYSLEPFKIDKKIIWHKGSEDILIEGEPGAHFQFSLQTMWTVYFRDKKTSWFWGLYPVIPFVVEIDKDTGDILSWGLKKE